MTDTPLIVVDGDVHGVHTPYVFIDVLEGEIGSTPVWFEHAEPHGFDTVADAVAWLKANRNHHAFPDVFEMVLDDLRTRDKDSTIRFFMWDEGSIVAVAEGDEWCEEHGQWRSVCEGMGEEHEEKE